MSSDATDPYQPPKARLADLAPATGPMATRRSRLFASLVDTLLLMIPIIPAQWAMGLWDDFPEIEPPTGVESAGWALAGWLLYLAFNGSLLASRGQTIGKLLLGIRIVRSDRSPCSFARILLARLAPFWLISLVPLVGPIASTVDVIAILGASRLCLHDRLADTVVVKDAHPAKENTEA